ncbi:helix-turn-helix domain-containing protein [Streptosporangium sp. NPDC051023]|uniref:AraC-like ligand-binding domain-containing protein n=1 Tax=Streptosporangium sp. NPDC051023 TaxID=3155410 RepID=UPI00344CDE9F
MAGAGALASGGVVGWQGGGTDAVAEADRFGWFAETISRALMPSVFMPRDPSGFYAEGAVLDLGPVQLSRFTYSPLRSRRTQRLIHVGDPEQYQLGLVLSGTVQFAQNSGEALLGAGGMTLWDTSRPYESGSGMDGRNVDVVVLQIPKAEMPLASQRIDPLLARPIPGGAGSAAILSDLLVSLAGNGPDCTPSSLDELGRIAVDLAASHLAHLSDASTMASAETRAHALLRRIDTFIDNHLADPDLTPRLIADRHHLSLRALYVLFQHHDEGVAASIRRRRLERCRADLASEPLRDQPVQMIAARWGFPHASSFSRAFRTAYGTTPHDYRYQALTPSHRPCSLRTSHLKGEPVNVATG